MTRVAAGQPSIWPDICADNAAAIVAALDHVLSDLAAIRDQVAAVDRAGILTMLQAASGARRALPAGVTAFGAGALALPAAGTCAGPRRPRTGLSVICSRRAKSRASARVT